MDNIFPMQIDLLCKNFEVYKYFKIKSKRYSISCKNLQTAIFKQYNDNATNVYKPFFEKIINYMRIVENFLLFGHTECIRVDFSTGMSQNTNKSIFQIFHPKISPKNFA